MNDALEEVAQSQNYISSAVDAEINRIQDAIRELEINATNIMDDNEISITMVAINSSKKINLLNKFASFLDVDIQDCLIEVDETLITIQNNAMNKFKQCMLSVLDETDAFSKDTVDELRRYYFMTYSLAANLQECPSIPCIEKTLSPLTQLANDAMIAISNLSFNTIELIYNMNGSFKQCSIGNIRVGEGKMNSITNAVAKCINDRVENAH